MLDFTIEQKISNLIESQFPSFYQEEGPVFIQFVKAYYEWLEEEGNVLQRSRNILNYTDIDETLEEFLVFFQKKYLYGIPFDVIINKRFLLKHVLDVYRSKGSIQCYRLLFRLIYNQDIDIYLPGIDLLRASDGTWVEGRYVEVTNVAGLEDLVGTEVIGISSEVSCVIESYIIEPLNENIIATLFISNIEPRNREFNIGEKLIKKTDINSVNIASIISSAPTVTGSLDEVEITSGGRDFTIGDVLKIVKRDLNTNEVISFGVDGLVRVTETFRGRGRLAFNILNGGFGYTIGSSSFVYNANGDITGSGASFSLNALSDLQTISYNTDLICDYADLQLDSSSFGLPLDPSANISSSLDTTLTFVANNFGSIATLTTINVGNNYTLAPFATIRSTQISNTLGGTISYISASPIITGVGTEFDRFFTANAVIFLQADIPTSTIEYHIIQSVDSNTQITLKGSPEFNSTGSATYRVASDILVSNYSISELLVFEPDGSTPGLNSNISAIPAVGNNVIRSVKALNSGKGYVEGEQVVMYLFGGLNNPLISSGGTGYSNGENLIFTGGNPVVSASGYIETYANGSIANTIITYYGAGYQTEPLISIQTANGSGAILTTTVDEFNTLYEITGTVKKTGIGKKQGYYSTTRGHLNSDKYIQDSYFYQDFSYQIKAALTLDKYRDILYDTFHTAGTELFGEFLLIITESSNFEIENEPTEYSNVYIQSLTGSITCDSGLITSDSGQIISDTFAGYLTSDSSIVTADYEFITLDMTEVYGAKFVTIDTDLETSDLDYDYLTADTTYIFNFEGMSFIRADSSLYKADITTIKADQRYIF